MTGNNVVPFVQPATPAVSFGDMERMAQAITKSKLFGIANMDQALALMLVAQAEGRHPALAARDYDIVHGRPAKKAEAMLRDFLTGGGRVEWHELTDTAADATFAHPAGGTVRIKWDMDRVKRAKISNPEMYSKYPRQMLRSRCVSEGVRTVYPPATSGMYEPGEVEGFAAPPSAPIDVTPKKSLDQFAAAHPREVIDAETGEVFDAETIQAQARAFARQGWKVLKTHLDALTDDAYEIVRPLIGTKEQPGELRSLAREADARRDPVDLEERGEPQPHSPAGTTPSPQPSTERNDAVSAGASPGPAVGKLPPQDAPHQPAGEHEVGDLLGGQPRPPAGYYRVPLDEPANAMAWDRWHHGVEARIKAGEPVAAILRDNKDNIEIFEQVDVMRHEKLMAALAGGKP